MCIQLCTASSLEHVSKTLQRWMYISLMNQTVLCDMHARAKGGYNMSC